MAKERIIFDPALWPRPIYNHIRYGQEPPVPEAFWTDAVGQLMLKPRRADSFESWWKDLSSYHPSLKGWKLAGCGVLPKTVLNPSEYPHWGDTKLAFKSKFLRKK